jgi:hypothetical protein
MDDLLRYCCIFVLACLGVMFVCGIDYNLMDYDEGAIYLYPGFLASHGLMPYRDFVYNQPPGWLINWGNFILGRMMTLASVALLLVAGFYFGRKYGVGYFAAVFIMACPLVMHYGRLAVADIPVMAVFTVFLYTVTNGYRHFTQKAVLVTSAVFCVLIKIQMIIPILAVCALVFVRRESIGVFYVWAGLLMLGSLLFPSMLAQTVFSNLKSPGVIHHIKYFAVSAAQFAIENSYMIPFALFGMLASVKRCGERKFQILYVVLLSLAVTSVAYSWLSYRQFMYSIPALGVFAGLGLKDLNRKYLAVFVILAALFVPVSEWYKMSYYDNDTRSIVKMVESSVSSNEMIYSDQPMIAALSGRMMPDSAMMWNGMGRVRNISHADVIRDIYVYRPKMVLLVVKTPVQMDAPRIMSTFGESGAAYISDYLDSSYSTKYYLSRNYQTMAVWEDPK